MAGHQKSRSLFINKKKKKNTKSRRRPIPAKIHKSKFLMNSKYVLNQNKKKSSSADKWKMAVSQYKFFFKMMIATDKYIIAMLASVLMADNANDS